MIFPLHLAMTAAEFENADPIPAGCSWMACHFSSYGTRLSNCPKQLPEGSILIVNDRTPPNGHDPETIAQQLRQLAEAWYIQGILLDFQRPDLEENRIISKTLTQALPCPVGVSSLYARELTCPVFLPPAPVHKPLKEHIAPWADREIWLEVALDCQQATITREGCTFCPMPPEPDNEEGFFSPELSCRYRFHTDEQQAVFTLWRTPECLNHLLGEAEQSGVTSAFGLYQELSPYGSKIGMR